MKRTIALLVFGISLLSPSAFAQKDPAGPPDMMEICTDTCTVLVYRGNYYVGLIEGGTMPAWRYHVDAWGSDFIALTGITLKTSKPVRREIAVISGVPDHFEDGYLQSQGRFVSGNKATRKTFKLKWDKEYLRGKAAAEFPVRCPDTL